MAEASGVNEDDIRLMRDYSDRRLHSVIYVGDDSYKFRAALLGEVRYMMDDGAIVALTDGKIVETKILQRRVLREVDLRFEGARFWYDIYVNKSEKTITHFNPIRR